MFCLILSMFSLKLFANRADAQLSPCPEPASTSGNNTEKETSNAECSMVE